MSVKHAILGLLYEKPRHGYEIKTGFEQMVHQQWPLNSGQVYTTLERLVRDRLVEPLGEDVRDRKQYRITEAGKQELRRWLLEPVQKSLLKDEMFFKWLCARKMGFPEIDKMIMNQKKKMMETILQLTQLQAQLDREQHGDMILLIEGGLLHLEADLKWLQCLEEEGSSPAWEVQHEKKRE
ncbi:PadR family transcriptional regulator [Lihuaxuella thermophila]|uniref:DNA-binding transcriptional regulator, PadR family n=1 Tax=Lihuaxuella thermophila TaxID=1173111 RepID=A0A1H8CDM8_9BACL|nr:PadR family transcriptional regulator [Lihuaxuella thermophila]SEM92534.1 DNA-binding transcriptional regulator, PadR family [Lihuaxuella thermophila]